MTRRPTPEVADALLPYFARTLLMIRTELDLSQHAMARELSDTEWAPQLRRRNSEHVSNYTVRDVEMAKHWPRDPDALVCAYSEVWARYEGDSRPPFKIWEQAMRSWAAESKHPAAAVFAKRLGPPALR